MNYLVTLLSLLFLNYKNVLGENNSDDDVHTRDNMQHLDKEWILYDLKTNPFLDLKHPNFIGSFTRSIDEYYVYETEEYNKYKKERYNKLANNEDFEKRQFNCILSFIMHGRPNSRTSQDYKIWSAQANIAKDEIMRKKKYSKLVIYAPFINMASFKKYGLDSHVNFAYIAALRLSMTLKKMIEDDTCYNYDIFVHAHCFGFNIIRILFNLNVNIWNLVDISQINLYNEYKILSILDDNFDMVLKNVDIVKDKSDIKIKKFPYFKYTRNYLYKYFKLNFSKKYVSPSLECLFKDKGTNYNMLIDSSKGDIKNDISKNIDLEEQEIDKIVKYSYNNAGVHKKRNKVVKRLHYYLLNNKINLLSATGTAPVLSGILNNVEDIKVGHQKFVKFKSLIKFMPNFIYKKIKAKDATELLHAKNPELFCILALEEKINYNYYANRGSLISLFKNVNYYADLDNDELISMYSSLGLYSPLHMRSLSYYLLQFRNEYYNRVYQVPVHLSPENLSDNSTFFLHIEKYNVCKNIKKEHLEHFISFVNELVNYKQRPKPYIPRRCVYKNPFLSHFKMPLSSNKEIYTPHTILGTGRTNLLLFSYEIYRHIAYSGLNQNNIIGNEIEIINDMSPFVYYNWLTYIGNQKHRRNPKLIKDYIIYNRDVNMNIVDNLFNTFTSTHFIKFFFFKYDYDIDSSYKAYMRVLKKFNLGTNYSIYSNEEKRKIVFSQIKNDYFNEEENTLYQKLDTLKQALNQVKGFLDDNDNNRIKEKVKQLYSLQEDIDEKETNQNEKESYEYKRYKSHYIHFKRTLKLDEVTPILSKANTNKVQIIEFIIKNGKYEDIEDYLNNIDKANRCLFHSGESFDLSYIAYFCNYNEQIYTQLNKKYEKEHIYTVKNLNECKDKNYKHLKLCENSILLKKYFERKLDIILKDIHHKEYQRMKEMRDAIERDIHARNILSLSNDSLVARGYSLMDEEINTGKIQDIMINVCFKHYEDILKTYKNPYLRVKLFAEKYENGEDSDIKVHCTHVKLPIRMDEPLIKNINGIYMRALNILIREPNFMKDLELTSNENSYRSLIYFFDKFSYVYNVEYIYNNPNDIEIFDNIPQNIKGNQLLRLKKYNIEEENYNNEEFLSNFFYNDKDETKNEESNNIYWNFLHHYTAFFYILKVHWQHNFFL